MASSNANHTIKVDGVSVHVPQDWNFWSQTIVLIGPQETTQLPAVGGPGGQAKPSEFQQNIVLVKEKVAPSETVESYVKKQTENLQKANILQKPPGPLEKVSIPGGRNGVLFEHVVFGGPENKRVRQMQLIFIHNGMVFALVASDLDGVSFEVHRETFRSILLSINL